MNPLDRLVFSPDDLSVAEACSILKTCADAGRRIQKVKIHHHLLSCPTAIDELARVGSDQPIVDLKLTDVPRTNTKNARALFNRGAIALTVKINEDTSVSAIKAVTDTANEKGGLAIGVTVLTSISEDEFKARTGKTVLQGVRERTLWAKEGGVHGIVCSPLEAAVLRREEPFKGLFFMTPGVRSKGKDVDDQKRVATPYEAILGGANWLVVGSQICKAPDPVAEIARIEQEIAVALGELEQAKAATGG